MSSESEAAEAEQTLASVQKNFHNSVKQPEIFLSAQPKKEAKFKDITKSLYDLSVHLQSAKNDPNILPELILDSMDDEQIWQQLELRNNSMMKAFLQETSRLLSLQKGTLSFKCRTTDADEKEELSNESDQENGMVDGSDDSTSDEDTSAEEEKMEIKKRPGKPSIVDDEFFKLSEMEEFLKVEDEKEMMKQTGKQQPRDEEDEDNEIVDYFENDESDEEDEDDEYRNLKYADFFGDDGTWAKRDKNLIKRRHDELGEEEENEVKDEDDAGEAEQSSDSDDPDPTADPKPKSTFEERQERLKDRIRQHEEIALGTKPWQLKGEITATNRPQNSLLEEILEFDSTTRPAPVITEETSLRLEDIIRQRIKDKAWDDVERKFKPVQTPQELRKKLVLDQEKSKESLAQIYEKEYRQQLEKLNPTDDGDEKDEEPASHKDIRKLMRDLFAKLDALSNYHYTPKRAVPEARIITNTPAVEMEEVAPVAMSTAKLLAPEEIRNRVKGDVLGNSERSKTDKNRERRKKKIKQKIEAKAKEERLEAKQKAGVSLTSKEEKAKLLKNVMKHRNVQKMSAVAADGNPIKSSKAFFSQLQDNVSSKEARVKKKKAPKEEISAKRLKL